MSYTPINKWKLSARGREILDFAEKIAKTRVENIHLRKDDFECMLDGVEISMRNCYMDGIPFMGKMIMRKV